MIDLSADEGDPRRPRRGAPRARARACLLGEFDRATQALRPGDADGHVSTTGIAGLTLGGGLGWLARKHGPAATTCSRPTSSPPTARSCTASADENPDLFWGLRGGGGNFGVVTAFEYRLHPVGPQVIAGRRRARVRRRARGPALLRATSSPTAPDELSVDRLDVPRAPGCRSRPSARRAGHHARRLLAGDLDEGERVLAPLRTLRRARWPISSRRCRTPRCRRVSTPPTPTAHNYWKSHFVDEICDDGDRHAHGARPRMTSPLSSFYFQHLGGAIGRAGRDDRRLRPPRRASTSRS